MKNLITIILLCILLLKFDLIVSSQTNSNLWPIKGADIGEGIICKPQDYIDKELNFDNLFITAIEGTDVISPCSGIIINYNYRYSKTLTYTSRYRHKYNDSLSVSDFDNKYRQVAAEYYKHNSNYISISIGIKAKDGKTYYISGLRPVQYFKIGTKINKGDIIGKVGYSYIRIKQPSISLSISINSKPADPMSIFGLKSTFIPPNIKKIDYKTHKHSVPKLLSDFKNFKKALIEGHPGLYDYVSKNELNQLFEKVKIKIIAPMTSEEFRLLLIPIVKSIKDSHTAILSKRYKVNYRVPPPILFGFKNDSLVVYSTIPKYKRFLNKKIDKIDGVNISDILPKIKNVIYGNDGFIKSVEARKLLMEFWIYYNVISSKKIGDEISISFVDGDQQIFRYTGNKLDEFLPTVNKADSINFSCTILPSKIAVIDINTFKLSTTDIDSVSSFIKQISDSSFNNMIIDVRDNRGGDPEAIDYIFSLLAKEPFRSTLYQKVNKKGNYDFFKYCLNYSAETNNIFSEYKKLDNKEGFYLTENKFLLIEPDTNIHFDGNVYVLTNEFSLSAATVFPSLIYKYNRGVIVGRETGTSYYQLNATKFAFVFLENTGLELYMPLIKSVFSTQENCNIPWGRGVLPKYNIEITFDEFLNKNDNIMDSTIAIINKKGNVSTYKSDKTYLIYLLIGIVILIIGVLFAKLKKKHRSA